MTGPEIRQRLLWSMLKLQGTPYLWGGKDPATGLDCSGAVGCCLEENQIVPAGWKLSHNADAIAAWCNSIPAIDAEPGDLVFYGSQYKINHVMMVAGEGEVVGAAGGGRWCTTIATAQARGAEVKKVRVGYRMDVVRYGRIPLP
jgi:cell wall-associated NlpC family hydrolase